MGCIQSRQPQHPLGPLHMVERGVQVRCYKTQLSNENDIDHCSMCITDDRIVISDMTNKNVKIFDKVSGDYLFQVKQDRHKLEEPYAVACNNEGEIFVTDKGSIKGIVRYDKMGNVMNVIPNVAGFQGDIACHGNKLIIADFWGQQIFISDFDCNVKHTITKSAIPGLDEFRPVGVCMDNMGHVVATDAPTKLVLVINYKKNITQGFLCNFTPFFVCTDKERNIMVTDFDKRQVMFLSHTKDNKGLSGPHVLINNGEVIEPLALAASGPSEVAVLERHSGDVKVFSYKNFDDAMLLAVIRKGTTIKPTE